MVLLSPGFTVNRLGVTEMRNPASLVALAPNVCALPDTLVSVRVTWMAPGSGSTLMLGRFRSTRRSGSLTDAVYAARGDVKGRRRVDRPVDPQGAGPAVPGSPAALPSTLTTSCTDDVICADLIWPGDQSGWAALISADAPAVCGAGHRGAGDRLVQLAGRAGGDLVRRGRVAGQHLDAGRRDVGLDELADRTA